MTKCINSATLQENLEFLDIVDKLHSEVQSVKNGGP